MLSSCLTEAQLSSLLFGDVPESERKVLEHHLDNCVECRQKLEIMAIGDGNWLLDARACVKAGSDPFPGPTNKIKSLPLVPAPDHAADGEGPGKIIGRYKILEQVGEGGFGVVYAAEQSEPVKRRVALKILKWGMDTKQVVARFEAERQALALMDHPNIAKVLDAGATDTGRPFFIMELVRGIKITDYCDENNVPTRERLELFVKVCQAIQHAHQKGIIHRDIKPSNILVTVRDGIPVPKVIDFGIAKATQGALTDKTIYTRLQDFIGTPAYMSPEQAEMSALDIDTRSDIYSLGVLLYELLTGTTPFDSNRLLEAGLEKIRHIIRHEEPPRPSTRISKLGASEQTTIARRRQSEPPKLIHVLQGDLDWIAMKCLEKDRTHRYETANGLASDVERHLRSEPVAARPPSKVYRLQKLIRRHKLAFAGVTAVLCSLLLGLGVSTALFLQQKAARHRADAEARKKEQVATFLQDMLKGVGPGVALGRDTKLLREILNNTAKRVGHDLTNQPEVEAELRTTVGAVYLALGMYPQSEEMHRRVLELRRKRLGNENLEVAKALDSLGLALQWQNKLAEAELAQREALALRRKFLGERHPDVATSINEVAIVLYALGKSSESERLHREALAMRRALFGNEHLDVALSLNNLAATLLKEGRFSEAERRFRESLKIRRKLLDGEHPALAESFNNLASALLAQGRLAEAEPLQREALAHFRRILGNDHPDALHCLNNLGTIVRARGHLSEAEQIHREALARRRKVFGAEHMAVAISLTDLARVFAEQGRLDIAESLHGEALAMRRKFGGNEHPLLAESLEELARLLQSQSRSREAEPLVRECLAIREKKLPDDWQTCSARSLLGAVLSSLDQFGEAEPLLILGCEGLKQRGAKIPRKGFLRVEEALARLVLFYKVTGSADRAHEYQRLLSDARSARLGRDVESLLNALEAGEAQTFHDLAWLLATSLSPGVRDGTNAVRYALQAVDKTERRSPDFLATLAAAYAESGDFEKAVRFQQEAISLAEGQGALDLWQTPLRCYKTRAAWRDYESAANGYRNQSMLSDLEALHREELSHCRRIWPSQPSYWTGALRRLLDALLMERKAAEAEQLFDELLPPSLAGEPTRAALLRERADFSARCGDWVRSAADATRLLELDPANQWAHLSLPLLLVAKGDRESYRRQSRTLMSETARPVKPELAGKLARLMLVNDPPENSWPAISAWADTALGMANDPSALANAQLTKGLAEYRQGHLAGALEWLEKARLTGETDYHDEVVVQVRAALALANHQSLEAGASANLARAIELAGTVFSRRESGNLGPNWEEWVYSHALIREAKTLLGWGDAEQVER